MGHTKKRTDTIYVVNMSIYLKCCHAARDSGSWKSYSQNHRIHVNYGKACNIFDGTQSTEGNNLTNYREG